MIFISYRRDDSLDAVDRLHTELTRNIPDLPVFRDAGGVGPSHVFPRAIQQAIQACDILLAIIGPNWATYGGGHGPTRLRDPHDWVHHEIADALARERRVLPVLVEGARAPTSQQLPDDLARLTELEPFVLRPDSFVADAERLAAQLGELLGLAVVEHPDADGMERVRAALSELDRLVEEDTRMDDLRPFRRWFGDHRDTLLAAATGVGVPDRLGKLERAFEAATGGQDATWELSVFEIRDLLRDLHRLFGVRGPQDTQSLGTSGMRILPGARPSEFPVGGTWECAAEGRGWKATVLFTLADETRFSGVLKTPRGGVARLLGDKRDQLQGNWSMNEVSFGEADSFGGVLPLRAVGLRLRGAHEDGEPFEWLIPIDERIAGGYSGQDRDGAKYFLRRK
jgi:hypothetical protein